MIELAINEMNGLIRIRTIHNKFYNSTNNIYSLWLVSDVIHEPFVLIESDLIVENDIYSAFTLSDRIALDKYDVMIHSGTTVTVDKNGIADQMYINQKADSDIQLYKTVNIYSFSKKTWVLLREKIAEFIEKGDVNIFYEVALHSLIATRQIELEMVDFSTVMWHEIDSVSDYERVVNATTLEYSNYT